MTLGILIKATLQIPEPKSSLLQKQWKDNKSASKFAFESLWNPGNCQSGQLCLPPSPSIQSWIGNGALQDLKETQFYFNSQKETGMWLHDSAPVGLVLNNGCLVLLSKSPRLWRIVSELCSIQPILFSHSCAPCIIPNLAIGGWSPNSSWVVCLISLSVNRLSGIPWSCVVIITIISSPSWWNRHCS